MEIFLHTHGAGKTMETATEAELESLLADETNFVWVDFENPSEADERIMENVFNFHPLTIEDSRVNHSQPKIEEFPDYLYMIVHGVRADTNSQQFSTKELDIFLGKNFVVTYHHENFRSVDMVKRQVRSSPVVCSRGGSYLLHQILDQLIDLYAPVIDDFDDFITSLEDRIFDLKKADNSILAEILALKRSVIRLRRISSKQMDVLYRLAHGEFPQIDQSLLPFYRDVYDHLQRVSDLAESYRDLISGLMDMYLSIIANRTNDVMKTLTIFSAIMLPITAIAGVYGMNFDNMPELHTPNGYYVVLALMGFVVVGMLVYFYRKGWLDYTTETAEKHPLPPLHRRHKDKSDNGGSNA